MTKENRHSIYARMLDILLTDPDYNRKGVYKTGLCDLLLEASGITDYEFRNFPEIAKHKTEPEDTEEIYPLWWGKDKEGTNNRIKVLEQAKKETEDRFLQEVGFGFGK